MKEFLAMWIVAQLLVIGWTGVTLGNSLIDKTYDCSLREQKVPRIVGAIIPLVFFLPSLGTREYCNQTHP